MHSCASALPCGCDDVAGYASSKVCKFCLADGKLTKPTVWSCWRRQCHVYLVRRCSVDVLRYDTTGLRLGAGSWLTLGSRVELRFLLGCSMPGDMGGVWVGDEATVLRLAIGDSACRAAPSPLLCRRPPPSPLLLRCSLGGLQGAGTPAAWPQMTFCHTTPTTLVPAEERNAEVDVHQVWDSGRPACRLA